MSEEKRKYLAIAMLIKLLEFVSNGAFKLMWADFSTGRVLLRVDPNQEIVSELMKAMPQVGGA